MPKSLSYRSRAGADCVVMDAVEGQACWGLVRFSSLGHYLCEGHRTPPDYLPEPVRWDPAEARAAAEAAAAAERAAWKEASEKLGVPIPESRMPLAEWVEHESNRWFRPLLVDIENAGVGLFWTDLSDVMLLFLHSAIGEGLRCGDGKPATNERLLALGRQATAEVHRRNLPWPNGAYDLQLAEEWDGIISTANPKYTDPFGERVLRLGFHHLSDQEVALLYGCAAVVADFSSLERGVRQVVMHVYNATAAELKRRWPTVEYLPYLDGQDDS